MKILGIDTSTKYLSVAITDRDRLIGKSSQETGQMHSAHLIPMIQKLLKKSKLQLKDIDLFSMSIGPGSFTGLRIGVSVVKGFVAVSKKPIVAVPTLDIIAQNASYHNGKVCVIVDARKQQIYACLYEIKNKNVKRISKYMLLKIDDLLKQLRGEVLFLGDGIALYKEEITKHENIKSSFAQEKLWYPDPYRVCALGFKSGKMVPAKDLVPMYIYAKTCTVTKPKSKI